MNTKVAVATVQGKAYFLVVNKLKEKGIPFLSLVPGEILPTDIKVVITTEEEKHLIKHERLVLYDPDENPEAVFDEVTKILQGKKSYDKIIIGIDPGEVYGLAVITDGKISETENCYSASEVLHNIKSLLRHVDSSLTEVSVRIGNGVRAYKDLLETLDIDLPPGVVLEVVSEAGTNRYLNDEKHRRGLRDIASATRIAGRSGRIYSRRRTDESNS
jgi:hypothetical protein